MQEEAVANQIGEEEGQATGFRVLPDETLGAKLEVSVRAHGKVLGEESTSMTAYVSMLRPDGTLYGEGQGMAMLKDGSMAAFTGTGIGTQKSPGGADALACHAVLREHDRKTVEAGQPPRHRRVQRRRGMEDEGEDFRVEVDRDAESLRRDPGPTDGTRTARRPTTAVARIQKTARARHSALRRMTVRRNQIGFLPSTADSNRHLEATLPSVRGKPY